jgi:hypothetical protein
VKESGQFDGKLTNPKEREDMKIFGLHRSTVVARCQRILFNFSISPPLVTYFLKKTNEA